MKIGDTLIYSGTSGLSIPIPKYLYPSEYQDKSRLSYYSSLFNSIEINSSFYKLPQASTVAKWAASVPINFKFTFKLWKVITHNKGLEFSTKDIERFLTTLSSVGNKKACILIQFPPSLTSIYYQQLERLLYYMRQLDPEHSWNVAVEFRHSSWYSQHIYDLLDSLQMSMVMHDIPRSITPMIDLKSNYIYLRFHGPEPGYRGSYADSFLAEYAEYITNWMQQGRKVYCYFNNTMGNAVGNLKTLNSFLGV